MTYYIELVKYNSLLTVQTKWKDFLPELLRHFYFEFKGPEGKHLRDGKISDESKKCIHIIFLSSFPLTHLLNNFQVHLLVIL